MTNEDKSCAHDRGQRRFGLAGHPLSGSLSPALFNAGYAGKYSYDLMESADFEQSWQAFKERYAAINVTAPFKTQAFAKADVCTACCRKIGAANIAVKTPDGILADNSDFSGIILSIAEAYVPGIVRQFYERYGNGAHVKVHQFTMQAIGQLFARRPQALVVGCGGAGRAAAVAAAELGFGTVLMNRTAEKAQALADELPEYGFIADQMADFRAAFRECDLVIYTLPLKINDIAMLTGEDCEGEDRYRWPRPGKVILEANYKTPSFAGAMPMLQSAGCQYLSGRRWLLYQALAGYSALTGENPDLMAMEQVMKNP